MPQTQSQIQKRSDDRKTEFGLKPFRGWIHPDEKPMAKEFIANCPKTKAINKKLRGF